MGMSQVRKYVWLVQTIYDAKKISLREINAKWSEFSGEDGISTRTFHRWREAVQDMFDINIENEKSGSYDYYIEDADALKKGGVSSWVLDTVSTGDLLARSKQIKSRILLEYVPTANEMLSRLIQAMQGNKVVTFTYSKFHGAETKSHRVAPYSLRLYKQRWYLLGQDLDLPVGQDALRTYGLDRISALEVTDQCFVMPSSFSLEDYYADYVGVTRDSSVSKQYITLKVTSKLANYLRALPLHASQQEERLEEGSLLHYYLRPTLDFVQEILKNGNDMEVIEPASLRQEVVTMIQAMAAKYQ